MTTRSPILPWIAAVLSGVLLALCFPNWNHTELVWVWQAPLLTLLWFGAPQKPTRRRWVWALWWGWLCGFAFFLINIKWIWHVTPPGMILMAAYLAVYFGIWAAFASTVGRLRRDVIEPTEPDPLGGNIRSEKLKELQTRARKPNLMAPSLHTLNIAFLNAAAWVALEWVRGWMFTGFGWNGLGVALHENLHMVQSADLVGVHGLSFLPMFVTCIGIATVARFMAEIGRGRLRPHLDFAVAMVLIILNFFYGLHVARFHPVEDPVQVRLILVQGNFSIEERWNRELEDEIFSLYENYTSLYTDQGDYDLVVWPETALPVPFYLPESRRRLNVMLDGTDYTLITGTEEYVRENEKLYNAMMMLQGDTENWDSYRKMHLVPFGEFIPFRGKFPPFEWILGKLIPDDFDRGTEARGLQLSAPAVRILPTICFEDTIGAKTRKFIGEGPEFILNITNDAWFLESEGSIQHLTNARFRAIELKRTMARCANTGVTCVIDRFGSLRDPDDPGHLRVLRDIETGSTFTAGVLPATLTLDSQPSLTLYARWGDWFAKLMAGLALLAAGIYLFRRKKRGAT